MSREFVTSVKGSSNRYSISFSEEEPETKESSRLTYSADFTRSFEESYKEEDDVLIVDIDYGQDQKQNEAVDGKEADSPESLSRSGSLGNSFSKQRPKNALRRYKSVEEVITVSPKKSKTKLHKTYSDYDYRYKGYKKDKASAKLTMSADLTTSHEEIYEGDDDVLIVDIDYNHGDDADHGYKASMEEDVGSSSEKYGMGNGAPHKEMLRKYKSVEDVHSDSYSDRVKDLRRTISGYELTFKNENEPEQVSKLSVSADFTTSHEEKVGPAKSVVVEDDDEFFDIDMAHEGRIFTDHFETSTPQKSKKGSDNGDFKTKNNPQTDSSNDKSMTSNGLSSVNILHDNRQLTDDQKSNREQADDQTSKSSKKFKIDAQNVNNKKGAARILDLASENQEVTLTLSPEINTSSKVFELETEDRNLRQQSIGLANGVGVNQGSVLNEAEMEGERRTRVLISMKGETLGAMEEQQNGANVDEDVSTDVQDKRKRNASEEGGNFATENKKNRVEVTLSLTGQTKAEYPGEENKEIPVEIIPERPIEIPAEVRPKENDKHEDSKVVPERKRVEVSLSLKGSQAIDNEEVVATTQDDSKTTEVVSDEIGLQLDDIIIEDKETEDVKLKKRAAAYLYFKGSHEPGVDSQRTDNGNISLFIDDTVKGDKNFEEKGDVEEIPVVIDEEVKVESVDQVMTMPGEEVVFNESEVNREEIKTEDLQYEDEEPVQQIIISDREIDVDISGSVSNERGPDKAEIWVELDSTKSDEEAELKEVETTPGKETSDRFRLTVSQGTEDAWVIVSEDEGSDNSDNEAENDGVVTRDDDEEEQVTTEGGDWKKNSTEDEIVEPEADGEKHEEKPDEVYENVIPEIRIIKDPEDILVKIIVTKAESMDEDQITGHYEVTEPLYSTVTPPLNSNVTPTRPNARDNDGIDVSGDENEVVSHGDDSEQGEPNSEGFQIDNMIYGLVVDHDNTTSDEGIYTEIDEVEDPNQNRPKHSENQDQTAHYGKPYEIVLIKEPPGDAEENVRSAFDIKSVSRLARLGRRIKFYLIGQQKHIASNEKQKEDDNETISSDMEIRYTFRLPEYTSNENEHVYETFNDILSHGEDDNDDDDDDDKIYDTIDDTAREAYRNGLFVLDSKSSSVGTAFGGLTGGATPLTEKVTKVYRMKSKTADSRKVKTETVRMFLGQERLLF